MRRDSVVYYRKSPVSLAAGKFPVNSQASEIEAVAIVGSNQSFFVHLMLSS
jgi:hypothetical protein